MNHASASHDAATERTPWFLLAVLGLAVFASVTAELLPPAVLLGMSATLDVDVSAIGLLVTVWAVTIVLGTFPLVRLTTRVPRKALLIGSLAVFACANVVVALIPVFPVVVGARVVSALMAAVTWSVIFGYVPLLVARNALGRAMSVVLGGGTLASVLGVPIGAFLAAVGAWQVAFLAVALVLLIAAAVVARWLPSEPGSGASRATRARVDKSFRGVLILLAAGALLLTGYMTLYAYVVPVLVRHIGLTSGAAGGVLLAAGVAGGFGLVFSGTAGDRWPRGALLGVVAAIPLGSAFVLVAVLVPAASAFAVGGVTLIGFGIGGVPPLFQARVVRVASPETRALASGSFIVVLNTGIALGSAAGAALFAHGGALAVAATAVAFAGISLVVFAVTTVTVRDSDSGDEPHTVAAPLDSGRTTQP